ncbi:UDP-glucose 4-epimerase [Lachnospiraceae bacterium G41]|nr:UDP-glucose 4-epimerase [Lachnospiraceae bacterium G41]
MSILITGTSGFVGKRVIEQMRIHYRSEDIITFSSSSIDGIKNIDSKNYEIDSDYLVNSGCEEVETLVHIGAFTPKSGSETNDINKSSSNIENTKRLLEALSQIKSLKRVVYLSTLDVYEPTDEIISEKTPVGPQTMYGWSKLYCEEMVKTFANQNNLLFCILRLGHVYGEGEEKYRKVMPVMIKSALKNEGISIYGDGEALRSFIYIEDVAKAVVNSLMLPSSDVINIVGNEATSINDLAEKIIALSGNDIKIEHIPSNGANRNYIFDNSKLLSTLLDSLTPLETGLKREMEYLKKLS